MAKLEPLKSRTVLQSLARFDLSKTSVSSPSSTSFTCVAIWAISDSQSLIYLGTHSGVLILLTLNSSIDDNDDDGKVKLLRFVSVSRSPICSVHVFAQFGAVLVVSDGYMYLVDLQLMQPVKKLGHFRGVSAVARRVVSSDFGRSSSVQEEEGVVEENQRNRSGSSVGERFIKRLGGGIRSNGVKVKEFESGRDDSCIFAVAAGTKVLIVELGSGTRVNNKNDRDFDGSFALLKEIQGIEGVKTMAWVDDSIIFGTANGYSLLSCSTGQVSLIFALPDTATTPCVKLLSKERNVLLLVDNAGIIVNGQGQPVGGSLVFRGAQESIAELSSYVVVAKDGKMELYHKRSGTCVQAISFGGTGVGRCFLADEEQGNGRFVIVAASSKVFCYHKIPSEEQIKELFRKKYFKEAISLAEELEAEGDLSREMLSFVHAQVGFLLLFDLHFEEAVDHFLLSETMQPSEIFPFVIQDPNRWSLLVPRNRYWGLHPPPAHIEVVVEDGLLAIQRAVFFEESRSGDCYK